MKNGIESLFSLGIVPSGDHTDMYHVPGTSLRPDFPGAKFWRGKIVPAGTRQPAGPPLPATNDYWNNKVYPGSSAPSKPSGSLTGHIAPAPRPHRVVDTGSMLGINKDGEPCGCQVPPGKLPENLPDIY